MPFSKNTLYLIQTARSEVVADPRNPVGNLFVADFNMVLLHWKICFFGLLFS